MSNFESMSFRAFLMSQNSVRHITEYFEGDKIILIFFPFLHNKLCSIDYSIDQKKSTLFLNIRAYLKIYFSPVNRHF